MNHIRLRMRQSAICPISAFLLTVCFSFPGLANANGQISGGISTTPTEGVAVETAGCELTFNPFNLYDDGMKSSIALNSSGLALEFHQSQKNDTLWYRMGKQMSHDENYIAWGNSQSFEVSGYWPAVALTKEGYVIVVWSRSPDKRGSEQFYRVGKIDPNGDENQSISWKTDLIHWDGGFNTSIAINDNGLIVGVHETNASWGGTSWGTPGTGLFYRVGHFMNFAYGDYTIAWRSGSKGINYDDGENPHIAINDHNQVVAVHQVTGESLLHYRRGTVSEGKITFADSQRYDNDGKQPAVVLLDSGLVLEVHSKDGLYSRTGKLDPSNSTLIDWSPSVKSEGSENGEYPALATNGRYAFQTHQGGGKIYYSGAEIYCPNL
jgi:hypothetical protein